MVKTLINVWLTIMAASATLLPALGLIYGALNRHYTSFGDFLGIIVVAVICLASGYGLYNRIWERGQ